MYNIKSLVYNTQKHRNTQRTKARASAASCVDFPPKKRASAALLVHHCALCHTRRSTLRLGALRA
ncbi:hypothetical protein HanRHA438_Chr17g0795061 [Helianthus annuus]|nr:hypothetical protein HanRHA438_Chr17g0795061 [Helianthus annuus]